MWQFQDAFIPIGYAAAVCWMTRIIFYPVQIVPRKVCFNLLTVPRYFTGIYFSSQTIFWSCWYICPQMHSFSGIFWKFEVHLGQFGTEIWFSEVLLNDCFSCWAVRGLEITGINSPPPSAPERKFLFPTEILKHNNSPKLRLKEILQISLMLSSLTMCAKAVPERPHWAES